MTKAQQLQQVADQINEILNEKTEFKIFVHPGTRALKWFFRYDIELHKGSKGAGYSVSRTDARFQLWNVGIDLDTMLAEFGLS